MRSRSTAGNGNSVGGRDLTASGLAAVSRLGKPEAKPVVSVTNERGVEGHAAFQTAGDLGTATQPSEPLAAVLDTPRIAGIKPGRSFVTPALISGGAL